MHDMDSPVKPTLGAETGPVPDIFSTRTIFARVVAVASAEADGGWRELVWAGLAAGLCITLSFLGMVHLAVFAGPENRVVTALLYPLGFLFIVLGRYQLYTENTLTPVVLVLTRRRSLPDLLRVWGIVLAMNLVGAVIGAMAIAWTGVLGEPAAQAAGEIAHHAMSHGPLAAFWKAVVAGWLVAGMTWIVHGTTSSTSRILVIWIFLYAVGAFDLVHCIAGGSEAAYAVITGQATVSNAALGYMLPAIAGNTLGGVVLVTLLNYAQTGRRKHDETLDWKRMCAGTGRVRAQEGTEVPPV